MSSSSNVGTPPPVAPDQSDLRLAEQLANVYAHMRGRLSKVIVGQESDQASADRDVRRGHCLLDGVPGLAKTLMVRTLATLST